jgi:hypothetical protein
VTCDRSVVFSGYFGFIQNWPPWYTWNIVESGVKHHNPNPYTAVHHNIHITWCCCLLTVALWVSLVVFSGVHVAQPVVFCVMFCEPLFFLLSLFFCPLYCLFQFMASDYPFDIFKLFWKWTIFVNNKLNTP